MGWDNKPSAFIELYEHDIAEFRTKILIDLLRMIIYSSPVDTGRFRGSHFVSHGTPVVNTIGRVLDPQAAMNAGLLEIAKKRQSAFEVAWITNSLPYASKLESGTSRQAPTGVYATSFNSAIVKYGISS